jgi:hypothetical protein
MSKYVGTLHAQVLKCTVVNIQVRLFLHIIFIPSSYIFDIYKCVSK